MVGQEAGLLMSAVSPFGLPRGQSKAAVACTVEWLGWFYEANEGVSREPEEIGLAKEYSSDGLPQKNEAVVSNS